MEIRQARITDLDSITEAERRCFPLSEADSREVFEQRLGVYGDSFLVAEKDGKIIGYINGCITNERAIRDEMFKDIAYHKPDGEYQAVLGLAVLPGYRGEGVAQKLMDELVIRTKAKGKKGIILTCKEYVIDFYTSYGYRNLGVSSSKHGGAVWYDMILEF